MEFGLHAPVRQIRGLTAAVFALAWDLVSSRWYTKTVV